MLFAYQDIALFNAQGAENVKKTTEDVKALSYRVSILADGDTPARFSGTDAGHHDLHKKST